MRNLQMFPKDITILCEFSISDIRKLRASMDLVEIKYDNTKPEEVAAKDFLTENFMEWLDATIKEVDGD